MVAAARGADLGEVFGALIVLVVGSTLLAALFTWWLTRKRRRPFWQLVLLALPMFLVAFVLVDNILANGRSGS